MSKFATPAALEEFLSTRSYISGYSLTAADSEELKQLPCIPSAAQFPNTYRWAVHVIALTGATVLASAATAAAAKPAAKPAAAKKAAAPAAEDFDDMFGDEEGDEEVDENGENAAERAATAARHARMEAARKLKEDKDAAEGKNQKKKAKAVEKSLVVLDVKPWEADADLEGLWKKIIAYSQEGLQWGETFRLEPVAFGVKKLVLTCTIVDSLVVLDDITENIEKFEDFVQSVEIASMNKL